MGEMTGKMWFPSNGSEGDFMINSHCISCRNEKFMHTQKHGDHQCDILNQSMITGPPIEQWVYDENDNPKCTAQIAGEWIPEGDDIVFDGPEEPNPDQLQLW